ncbi:hypothetical protein SeLEV6574_g04243 [Synchytrium endobioticum]|nr:hypothetical protein SeLEV6574_g04243 [Synchytrium endobioticum]
MKKLGPKLQKAGLMLTTVSGEAVIVEQGTEAFEPTFAKGEMYLNTPLHADVLIRLVGGSNVSTFYGHWAYLERFEWFKDRKYVLKEETGKEEVAHTLEVNAPVGRQFLEVLRYVYTNHLESRWFLADNIMDVFLNAVYFDLRPVVSASLAEFPKVYSSIIQKYPGLFHHSRFGVEYLAAFCECVATSGEGLSPIFEMCLVYSQGIPPSQQHFISDIISKLLPPPPRKPIFTIQEMIEFRRRFGKNAFDIVIPSSEILESARGAAYKLSKMEAKLQGFQTYLTELEGSKKEGTCGNCKCVLPSATFSTKKPSCPHLRHTSGFDGSKWLCCGSLGHVKGCVIEFKKHSMA